MNPEIIYSSYLKGFRPIILYSEAIYVRSAQIKKVLKERLGEEYAELLADTYITDDALRGHSTAIWLSSYISKDKSVPFSSLPKNKQEVIAQKLDAILQKIENLAQILKNEGDSTYKQLGEILTLAKQVPSPEFILVEGEKIVFVFWGFVADDVKRQSFQVRKYIQNFQQTENVTPTPPITHNNQNPTDSPTENPPKIAEKPPVASPDKGDKRKIPKWIWGLLAALLLVLLILGILMGARSCNHAPLPPNPGVYVPIDSANVVENPNDPTKGKIVSDRLNIYLDKSVKMTDFSKQLTAKFSTGAKIIFYDTTYNQLQIQIEDKDREGWKKKLKEAFPKEIRVILEEGLYMTKYLPSDPAFKSQMNSYHFKKIKALEAWDKTKGNADIVIAIIDDGFDVAHPEISSKIINPWNVVTHSKSLTPGSGHGTHVAALSAGSIDNAQGGCGTAPICKIMPIQVADEMGMMSTTSIVQGIIYAFSHGADVVNLSLGKQMPGIIKALDVQAQKEMAKILFKDEEIMWDGLFQYADEFHCIIVQAAGNDNVVTGLDAMKRSEYTIIVAASDSNNTRADFSNFGDATSVSAPGVGIYSAFPHGKYMNMDGTSMASPIVAGAVGLMKSMNKDLRVKTAKKILIDTGIPVTTTDADHNVGPLIQLDKALGMANNPPTKDCEALVDSLQKELEKLKQECGKDSVMKMPKKPKDCAFAHGKWQSSTPLKNIQNKQNVELLFDFDNACKGEITYKETSVDCKAALDLSIKNDKLIILQPNKAPCSDKKSGYEAYRFECEADENGVAKCIAIPKDGTKTVEFILRKR